MMISDEEDDDETNVDRIQKLRQQLGAVFDEINLCLFRFCK